MFDSWIKSDNRGLQRCSVCSQDLLLCPGNVTHPSSIRSGEWMNTPYFLSYFFLFSPLLFLAYLCLSEHLFFCFHCIFLSLFLCFFVYFRLFLFIFVHFCFFLFSSFNCWLPSPSLFWLYQLSWNIDLSECSRIWRGGCIIRAVRLNCFYSTSLHYTFILFFTLFILSLYFVMLIHLLISSSYLISSYFISLLRLVNSSSHFILISYLIIFYLFILSCYYIILDSLLCSLVLDLIWII